MSTIAAQGVRCGHTCRRPGHTAQPSPLSSPADCAAHVLQTSVHSITHQEIDTTKTATGESARVYKHVPQLARIRQDVLLGDVWKQPELAYRDRVLVTLGVLAAGGKVDEMKVWMRRGVEEAGLTLDDLRGLIVQVTFYAGWPAGLAAGKAALELFEAGAQ